MAQYRVKNWSFKRYRGLYERGKTVYTAETSNKKACGQGRYKV